jgi:hypothetical protein
MHNFDALEGKIVVACDVARPLQIVSIEDGLDHCFPVDVVCISGERSAVPLPRANEVLKGGETHAVSSPWVLPSTCPA